jgi:hypothetical protein
MGIPVLILGNSGTGKTTSLRNLDPKTTLLIQSVKKSLPFKSNNWKPLTKDNRDGSILVTRDYPVIHKSIHKAVNELGKKIIIIDDSNYLMSLEEMSRVNETGYKKFTDMAINFSGLIFMSQDLPDDVRVYFMAHTQTADDGRISIKTTGKMLDDKIVVEGLFTIVLHCHERDGHHFFTTKKQGGDPVKTPMGMFDSEEIDNDLNLVDSKICDYEDIA